MSRPGRVGLPALVALCLVLPSPAAAQSSAPPRAPATAVAPAGPEAVGALGAVVYDPSADRVLWGRAEDVGIPMASTTKIMTTLLALEAGTLDDVVLVSRRAALMGGAGLGLRMGQELPMRSLLAGLMLRSGNDAATAVAEHVAGSEEAFVRRMNARATELGLTDTLFLNASGLTDDRRHRASPLDLARLTRAAMHIPEFAEWVGTPRLTVPALGTLANRNELVGRYTGATGVKTGFLTHAGQALVASAEREELELYAVVLGSQDNFGDAIRLLDWGFATFRLAQPAVAGTVVGAYRWAGAETGAVAGAVLGAAVRRDGAVTWRVRLRPAVPLPVRQGAVLGEAQLLEAGRVLLHVPVRAAGSVAAVGDAGAEDAAGTDRAGHAAMAGRALQDALRALSRIEPLAVPA